MLVSFRRVAFVTYAVIIFVVVTTYGILWKKNVTIPISFLNPLGNSISHSDSPETKSPVDVVPVIDLQLDSTADLATDLATETKAPRFAYAQYATNLEYLCNTVSVPCGTVTTPRTKLVS